VVEKVFEDRPGVHVHEKQRLAEGDEIGRGGAEPQAAGALRAELLDDGAEFLEHVRRAGGAAIGLENVNGEEAQLNAGGKAGEGGGDGLLGVGVTCRRQAGPGRATAARLRPKRSRRWLVGPVGCRRCSFP